jgi:hypothetical protein
MTHEELLDKIGHWNWVEPEPVLKALRAVVERHTHVLTGKKMRGKAGLRKRCTECGFAYPCPTIEVIERALDA